MSVVGTAQELPDSPTLKLGLNERSYTRMFRVQVNSVNDGPITVVNAPGVPAMFSPYNFGNDIIDGYALVRDIHTERFGPAQLYWRVTVEYRTPKCDEEGRPSGGERDAPGSNDNPLLVLPEVDTSTERFEEVMWGAYSVVVGQVVPVNNSAGSVYDPPPTKDASRLTLTITRNETIATAHPSIDIQYADTLNQDYFWGSAPGVWKCQGITTKRETKQLSTGGLFPYLRVTYKFAARPLGIGGWDLMILDAGPHYWTGPNMTGKKLPCTVQGSPAILPLDGKGQLLVAGKAPVFVTIPRYQRVPFGPLQLPQSFQQIA